MEIASLLNEQQNLMIFFQTILYFFVGKQDLHVAVEELPLKIKLV